MTTTITALTKAKNTLAGLVTSTSLELESKTFNFLRCYRHELESKIVFALFTSFEETSLIIDYIRRLYQLLSRIKHPS